MQPYEEDDDDDDDVFSGMKLTGENRSTRGKPVAMSLCPPQIPHGLIRDRTRASAVGGRRLTA